MGPVVIGAYLTGYSADPLTAVVVGLKYYSAGSPIFVAAAAANQECCWVDQSTGSVEYLQYFASVQSAVVAAAAVVLTVFAAETLMFVADAKWVPAANAAVAAAAAVVAAAS